MSVTTRPLRVATRSSRLALAQTEAVVERLRRSVPGVAVEIVPMTTRGDHGAWQDGARGAERVGAFVKELEVALQEGRADLAVHSLKDVPTDLPEGLVLGAFPEREDPRDVLVLPPAGSEPVERHGHAPTDATSALAVLGTGARLGTSSQRRGVQLRLLRPDLVAVPVRGNVETRLRRLDEGQVDALVLAGAGLRRLGLAHRATVWLGPEAVVPAAGQGTLAVECRADDGEVREALALLDRPELRAAAEAERAFLARTGAGCRWPVGAWARMVEGQELELVGFVAIPAGEVREGTAGWMAARGWRRVPLPRAVEADAPAWVDAARQLGESLADELLQRVRSGEGTFLESGAAGGV
ncbi:hydroxymethylbilane synthase [Geochorda subterranea]|uniref:Porphobilinogen deaminase n=1 Tax=Geochorda subterranea TaxID=3109564 RepID=A0ABZ1BQM3_9FIRM|nr:hydroxymethylbilane synthase [Limnochorda sp. LNt]WRP14948.1 hydroxymethylbilane synthase [Limnochorda sp. LNt]